MTVWRTRDRSAPSFTSTWAATPSPSRMRPEEDVLRPDVVVAELQRLSQGQLQHLLGPGRERDVPRRRRATAADDLLHLAADGLQRDAERLEGLRGHALSLVDEAEQDVLRPDVGVAELAGLFLGEDDDPAGPIGESLEHGRPFESGYVGAVYPRGVTAPRPDCRRMPGRGRRPFDVPTERPETCLVTNAPVA